MQPWMIDAFLVLMLLGITYALTSEGLWGAGLMFFNILFAVLVAMNFYEPLAQLLATNVSAMKDWSDFICLSALFLVSLVLFKTFTENVAPRMVRFPMGLYQVGRLVLGFGAASLTVGFLMLVLDTAPVHRKIAGVLDYQSKSPFNMALDRKLLGFFQWTTAFIFPTYGSADDPEDPYGEFGRTKVFDPQGRWLLDHQNSRPFPSSGEGKVTDGAEEAPAAAAPAEGAAGEAGGQAAPGANADNSPRVPGGTAGAAAGLAPQG